MKVLIIGGLDLETTRDITFSLRMRYPEVEIVTLQEEPRIPGILKAEQPDLVILDSASSQSSSLEVVAKIREVSNVPLIMFGNTDDKMTEVTCLEAGVDDYIVKPIQPLPFLAITTALLRRAQILAVKNESNYSVEGRMSVSFSTHEVLVNGRTVKLTPTEFKLLSKLVKNEGRILPVRKLLEAVWGLEDDLDFGFVKKYVYRLRSKLEDDASNPQMLLTERGIGYRFVRPD